MGDSELVALIVAGDLDGLAAAYDKYADPLYKYCRSMLSSPADAADAVQDTFVIAASRLAGLREPGRLRAWLYAVARNECLRILRAKKTTPAFGGAPDVTGESAGIGEDAARAGLRALLEEAVRGLNPGEREVVELRLRQGLESAEVAIVLAMSRNRVRPLLSRARVELEACLVVLLVARAGREKCARLSALLTGWDGRLTVSLRKRAYRHIGHCATCTARRAFELRPAMLLGLSPGAAMAAAAAESLRVAAGSPAGLQAHTLTLAAGRDPGAIAHRAAVLGRAGSFGRDGFPRPAHGPAAAGHTGAKRGLRSSPRGEAAVAAGAVLAVVIGAIASALSGSPGHGKLAASPPPAGAPAPPGKSTAAAAPLVPARPAAASTPTASLTAASPGPRPTPTPAPPPKPTPGTLDVSPPGGPLWIPPGGTTISLTAQGGPVTWRAAVPQGPGHVSVSPSSGTLTEGESVTVTITASHPASGEQVTVEPGGTVFTILARRGHGHRRHKAAIGPQRGDARSDCLLFTYRAHQHRTGDRPVSPCPTDAQPGRPAGDRGTRAGLGGRLGGLLGSQTGITAMHQQRKKQS